MSVRTAQRTEAILREITSAENVLQEQRPADSLVQYAGDTAEYVHSNTVGSAELTYQSDTVVQGSSAVAGVLTKRSGDVIAPAVSRASFIVDFPGIPTAKARLFIPDTPVNPVVTHQGSYVIEMLATSRDGEVSGSAKVRVGIDLRVAGFIRVGEVAVTTDVLGITGNFGDHFTIQRTVQSSWTPVLRWFSVIAARTNKAARIALHVSTVSGNPSTTNSLAANWTVGEVYTDDNTVFPPLVATVSGGRRFVNASTPGTFTLDASGIVVKDSYVPETASSPGRRGQVTYGIVMGTPYIFVCVSENSWKRAALASFV